MHRTARSVFVLCLCLVILLISLFFAMHGASQKYEISSSEAYEKVNAYYDDLYSSEISFIYSKDVFLYDSSNSTAELCDTEDSDGNSVRAWKISNGRSSSYVDAYTGDFIKSEVSPSEPC